MKMGQKVILPVLLSVTACGSGNSGSAKLESINSKGTKTIETLITCEQDDGDQWKSVGIALNDGPGLVAYVVDNDDDNGSRKLSLTQAVSESKTDGAVTYSDSHQTFKLTVEKSLNSRKLIGSLSILADGPGGISLSDMECYQKGSIKFDRK